MPYFLLHKSRKTITYSLLWFMCSLPLAGNAQPPVSNDIRAMTESWLAIERQQHALAGQWQQEKQQLEMRQQLLQEEQQRLRETIASHAHDGDALEEARLALLEEQNALEREQQLVDQMVERLRQRINALHPILPPPLQEAWNGKLRNIAQSGNQNSRLQAYLEMFTMLRDFQNMISVHEGLIITGSGQTLQVQQLYLGASRAWYVSTDGQHRGAGMAGTDSWQWQEQAEVDPAAIRQAIAMTESNNDLSLVSLPISLNKQNMADISSPGVHDAP